VSHRLDVRLLKRLPGFTLDVEWTAGEGVAALFGPSGAGKTLTLQCLSGLLKPDAGRVVVDDRVLFDAEAGVDLPPQRRQIGYVFQGYALFPHLSVVDNIGFGLRDRPRAEARRRAAEVIARMGLEGLEDRRPHELSGGQRQRVALGRALAPDPALLLLDEPLSALDATLRQSLRDDLRRILGEWRTAAVLVTHDFTEAYRLGDRIVVYEAGRVIQSAPRAELLWQPASERVAGIVGIRNVLHGIVLKATPERIQFRWRGQVLEAVNSPTRSYLPAPESPLAFFIRPEYVRLIRKDRDSPDPGHHMNLMEGRVVGEADFGTTWTLYVRLDAPGSPAQGDYDLEIEVPRLVYEILDIGRDRHWQLSIHRGSIHVLPSTPLSSSEGRPAIRAETLPTSRRRGERRGEG
jgi:molybdate transport system ATP-binding protein